MHSYQPAPVRSRIVRGVFAGVLGASMTFGGALPAFAVTDADTASITIAGTEAAPSAPTANAYKVIDVNWDDVNEAPQQPQYFWANEVRDWVKANYPQYINAADGSVTEAFDVTLSDNGEVKGNIPADNGAAGFYSALSAAISAGDVKLPVAATRQGDGTIANLNLGSYLVLIEGGMKVYRPSVAGILPVYDDATHTWNLPAQMAITVKASEVPIEKTVDDPQVGFDDTATFTLTSSVPVYPTDVDGKVVVNKKYLIADKLPAGLTFKDDNTFVVKGVAADGKETVLKEGTEFTRNTDGKAGNVDFDGKVVDFALNFKYDLVKQYKQIKVTYTADVNIKAVIGPDGNKNDAEVQYTNNPYDENSWETKPVDKKVYTYGVDLTKTDENNAAISGAVFALKTKGGADALAFTKTGDGEYALADAGAQGTTTELEVSATGELKVNGLDTGSYELTETKAPAGYVKLDDVVAVDIVDDNVDGVLDANANQQVENAGYLYLTVQNTKGFTFPKTGGMGTVVFAAAGIAIDGVGAGVHVATRKRNGKNDAE